VLSFVLSIDYSLGLISTQAYWVGTHGNIKLCGLVFGLYDSLIIVSTPLLGWLQDYKEISYKKIFSICLIINMIGNLMYALADYNDTWVLILFGRLIGGLGNNKLDIS